MKNMSTEGCYFGHQLRKIITCLVLIGLLVPGSVYAQNQAPRLSVDNTVATAGFFRLHWETQADQVELQAASTPEFQDPYTVYTGPDRATVISGVSDGILYYRVRALDSQQLAPWSDPVMVEVKHHGLPRAFMFLSLGILVFLITVTMIIRGARKEQ
jgi:hypothetical protein